MCYEIFRFELKHRLKRPETYLFFVFLLAFSVFGVDFIFQGVELGMVKKNAPMVIGKTMGAITGIFMILASMIMGMPMIRDDQNQIASLIYATPVKKSDLLIGRFLGSFLILAIIFGSIPLGMMIGENMPWHIAEEMLPFRFASYMTSFTSVVLPTLFFGASLFFITGALSRKLLIVYTQGIIFFVVFLLTKSITNEYLQAIFDPFTLTTITQFSKDLTPDEKNTLLLSFSGILLANRIFWTVFGILILIMGYYKFNFTTSLKFKKSIRPSIKFDNISESINKDIPKAIPEYGWSSKLKQFYTLSIFYSKSLLKETSFWAIVICGVIIIFVNSISLGTVYGVDSFPTTYFIVEELQELSLYFFIIILLFYSGELFWKEHSVGLSLMSDATPISSLVRLSAKMTGLISIYVVLMLSLILSGIAYQVIDGYYHFDLSIYFSGFFIEILPFLVIYTFVAFFIQSLVHNKFLGILITLIFMICMILLEPLGFFHVLFNYGGGGLKAYSEMNGYGHFMAPYLWTKLYWMLFGILLLIIASLISKRGADVKISQRLKQIKSGLTRKTKIVSSIVLMLFVLVGTHVYNQNHILNKVWTDEKEQNYRANYEKKLKQFEYLHQPSIVNSKLHLDLYPDERSYELKGEYFLKNEGEASIEEIHVQKIIESDISLHDLHFSEPVTLDSQYQEFYYFIYQLSTPLMPGDSLTMKFTQTCKPKGYNTRGNVGSVIQNGTFIRNNEFPTLGYNKKYELREQSEREWYALGPRTIKADLDDINELKISRSGSDSKGVTTNIIIGTEHDQTAVTSGNLVRKWVNGNRNYFEYHSSEPIIDFYSILSGRFDLLKDVWVNKSSSKQDPVDLEIYYHKRHSYNLDRMMDAMKASLDYYSTNYSPYQYDQLRIVEFPRYDDFAQSFPNTIPFSESLGFMLDIDDLTDIDMTFFVTAHEVAHQWWGLQVETANVKGRDFVLETMSQYSALMVFKNKFSKEKLDQLIALQQELYEKGKNKSKAEEVPLYLVENEQHIYYNKGAVAMFHLQELIGEKKVNQALQSFIKDWNFQNGKVKVHTEKYATSEDLISYILDFTSADKKEEVLNLLTKV